MALIEISCTDGEEAELFRLARRYRCSANLLARHAIQRFLVTSGSEASMDGAFDDPTQVSTATARVLVTCTKDEQAALQQLASQCHCSTRHLGQFAVQQLLLMARMGIRPMVPPFAGEGKQWLPPIAVFTD